MSTPSSPECDRTNELLLDYAYGELASSVQQSVERHLPGCQRCQQDLSALRSTRRVMTTLPIESAPQAGLESLLAFAEQQAARQRAPKRPVWVRWLMTAVPIASAAALIAVIAPKIDRVAPTVTKSDEEAPNTVAFEAPAPKVMQEKQKVGGAAEDNTGGKVDKDDDGIADERDRTESKAENKKAELQMRAATESGSLNGSAPASVPTGAAATATATPVVTAPATTVTKNVDASKSAADHAKDIGGGDSLASERGRSFDLPAMPAKPPPPPPAQAQTLTFREADKKVSPADEKPSRREALPENKADAPQHHEHASKKSDPYLFGGDAKRSSVGQAADPNATLDTGAMGGELANDNKPAEAAGPNSLAQKAEGGRLARDDENPKDLDNLQGSFKKQIVKEAAKGKKKAYRPNSNDKGDQSPAKGSSGEGHAVALNGDLHDTSDATRGAGMPSAGTAGLLPTSNTQSESNKTASTTPKTSAPMATPTTPAVAAAPTPPPAPEPTMREEEGLESAERSAEKAAERERKQAQSELRDGYLAQRDNRHEQAAKHFLSFAEQNPDDARAQDALFQAAAEKAKQGNTEEAVQLYLRFANTYSSEKRAPTALFEAARLLYLRGETARAIQIQSQLEKQFPSSPEISRLTQMRSVSGPAHPAPAKRSKASSAYGATDDEYQAPAPASAPASAPAAADSLQQLSK